MQIAITGASGFLGRYLVRRLLAEGHQITAWCRQQRPSSAEFASVRWIPGQLGDYSQAQQLVDSMDAVVHSALDREGASFLSTIDDPLDYWHRNATGSLQLLDAARRAGVKRFVSISSGAVHDTVLPDRPLDETHPLLPATLYGACKASVETLVHHYGVSGEMITATLRPPSIYGVAEPIEDSKWYELVRKVCFDEPVHALGGSKAVHAADLAIAVSLLLRQDESISGQTFNCCDRMISDFEVATVAKRISSSMSIISGAPKTAKHEIDTTRIRTLGMQFGGMVRLQTTITELAAHIQSAGR